jgi:hypothetical protein
MEEPAAGGWRASASRRAALADALGLGAILLVLLDYLRPSLLLLPTIAAGGDTPCHYPTAAWFHQQLLPHLRLHGWYPGAYLGHPLLLYYFPLPFLVMSALAPLLGMPVAFKLGTVLGVFLLPLLAYASFRLMRFRAPTPLLAAAFTLVFLFLEENPIWGGTIASTLTGEFSYTYGAGLAVLFLGVVYRTRSTGGSPWWPALALALTALAHGYAVLWGGLTASFFLYGARQPGRTFRWLAALAALAFAAAAFWLLPLLADWGWTTPYHDPWITVTARNLFPPLLAPLFAIAAVTLGAAVLFRRRTGGVDRRLLFLLYSAAVAAALTAAGPALGIIDVRFAPFAQLALCLLAAAGLGLALQEMRGAPLAALGLTALCITYAEGQSRVLRAWIDWNYTGLEAKELWTAWRDVAGRLHGDVADPRATVEYATVHEKAGSIRMYETLPFFSGRSTLEGVYNQASLQTHFVYYLTSELAEISPNPFRSRHYSRFDTPAALRHLRLFNVRDVVAVSEKLTAALRARPEAELLFRVPPYSTFRLRDHGPGYVEPMSATPVRSHPRGWRDKAYRWFTREPLSPAHLVFTEDPRFELVERDGWLAPPEVPLSSSGGVTVSERVTAEEVHITTDRVGHPLLVKISYHPRWRAEGADGPYLVSPALMMVIPRRTGVRLYYARTAVDALGLALTAGVLGLAVAAWAVRRRARPAEATLGGAVLSRLAARLSPRPEAPQMIDACDLPPPPRSWGWTIPTALLAALALARLLPGPAPADVAGLHEQASRAYAEGRFADAAEYARHALEPSRGTDLRAELLSLRAESLARAGQRWEALEVYDAVVSEGGREGAYVPQALFGTALIREQLDDTVGAAQARERLLAQYGHTPWAERARAELKGGRPAPAR